MIAYTAVQQRELFETFADAGLTTGFGNDRLRIGPVKRIVDGDATASTAALRRPYEGKPNDTGFIYHSQEEMDEFFLRSHKAGFQLTAHAAGDRAIDMVLNAIEKALAAEPHPDPRPRIEHCAVLDPELMQRIKELGVIPVPQPVMFYDFGDAFLRDYGARCRFMFPCRSLMDMGVPVAASSDAPVATLNPFVGMYEAMTRKARSGQVVALEERTTLEQTIRMYTINGAYASFEEGIKGSLEPGKLADLVVVSGPILGVDPERVRDMRAEMTLVGGEIAHDKGAVSFR
jgi:predicted amidohydrolase YtcJ